MMWAVGDDERAVVGEARPGAERGELIGVDGDVLRRGVFRVGEGQEAGGVDGVHIAGGQPPVEGTILLAKLGVVKHVHGILNDKCALVCGRRRRAASCPPVRKVAPWAPSLLS